MIDRQAFHSLALSGLKLALGTFDDSPTPEGTGGAVVSDEATGFKCYVLVVGMLAKEDHDALSDAVQELVQRRLGHGEGWAARFDGRGRKA